LGLVASSKYPYRLMSVVNSKDDQEPTERLEG
jgi:hypothetical protein